MPHPHHYRPVGKEFARKKQRELEAATRAGTKKGTEASQRRTGEKVGRNDPCPCGSDKKYKNATARKPDPRHILEVFLGL